MGKKKQIGEQLEDRLIIEVSFGPNKQTRKVVEIILGTKVDIKAGDVIIVDGKKEFVVRQTSSSLTTAGYDESGKIVEGTRILNNSIIYDFHRFTDYQRYHSGQSRHRNLKEILDKVGIYG